MPRALSIGISGDVSTRLKELHDLCGLSYTNLIRELMKIAGDYYVQKAFMEQITLNLSKGMPYNLQPPPKKTTITTTTTTKVVSIESYFTQETKDVMDDLKHELMQVVGLKPSEIVQLIQEKSEKK